MNKEQPPIVDKEKEPTLEDIKEHFEGDAEIYESLTEKFTDASLKDRVGDRLKILIGHRDKKDKRVPGLIEKFGNKNYEDCLKYIEEVLGSGSAEVGNTDIFDLVNYKEYGPHIYGDRNKDIQSKEYQEKKNQLRKLADALTGEIYKDRKIELDEILSEREQKEVAGHITDRIEKDSPLMIVEFKKDDYKKILDFLDKIIHQDHLKKEGVLKWRRYRRFFLEKLNL